MPTDEAFVKKIFLQMKAENFEKNFLCRQQKTFSVHINLLFYNNRAIKCKDVICEDVPQLRWNMIIRTAWDLSSTTYTTIIVYLSSSNILWLK